MFHLKPTPYSLSKIFIIIYRRDLFWELKGLQGILNEEKNLREQLQQAVKDFLNYLQNENVPIDNSAYLYLQILATTASANEQTWNNLKLANNKS